jgi:Tfp pilus assembly protein PilF
VYAFDTEIDSWRESRRQLVDAPEEPLPAARSSRRWLWLAAGGVLVLLAGAGWWWRQPGRSAAHQPDPEAVRLLQLANFSGNAGRTQVETGLRYIEDALRRDPMYARAWSSLATAHLVRVWFGETPPAAAFAQAKQEAAHAIELDASLSSPWRVLGFISHYADWNQTLAETQFRKAIELSPDDAVAHSWFGDYLLSMRRFDEARTHYSRAQVLLPRWLEPIAFAGNTHLFSGNPDMAIVEYTRALESEPTFGLANHYLGRALVARGAHEDGIARLRKSNELLGEVPFSLADLGYALATGGKRTEAEAMRDALIARRGKGYYPAYPVAAIELGLGHTPLALDWLERAADERNIGFYLPSVDPMFDRVRSDPRFVALMRRMGVV